MVLLLQEPLRERVVAHCVACLPLEACGLLAGRPLPASEEIEEARESERATCADDKPARADLVEICQVYPAHNAAASERLYTVEPTDLLRADRSAEAAGLSLVGVWHSHTQSEAYPSTTDVDQAPDPDWHYVVVSLRGPSPVLRSFRIVSGAVTEEPVVGSSQDQAGR